MQEMNNLVETILIWSSTPTPTPVQLRTPSPKGQLQVGGNEKPKDQNDENDIHQIV